MVTSLGTLVDLMEKGAVPAWLQEAIATRKAEILKALQDEGAYTLTGPNGERVNIAASKKTAVAA